jgi:hypothetical protein
LKVFKFEKYGKEAARLYSNLIKLYALSEKGIIYNSKNEIR